METEDGVTFRPDTVQVTGIRKEANYAGVRLTLLGLIDGARCPTQLDIGFGDAVTPGPEKVLYPVMLLYFQAPKLHVYPRYTVVAEKLEAKVLVAALRNFLLPPIAAVNADNRFPQFWPAGGPWTPEAT